MVNDFAPNEIVWRFDAEDDRANRYSIHATHKMPALVAHPVNTVLGIIERWADDDPGAWTDGDLVAVRVIWPKEMAGIYKVSLTRRVRVAVYDRKS